MLAMDNLNAQVPKRGSRIDMPEIELAILGRECLDRQIDSAEELTQEIAALEAACHAAKANANRRFITGDRRIRLKKRYP